MLATAPESFTTTARTSPGLRLLVRNHPGVMSHLCGLLARRGFNVEGVVCVPIDDGTRSVILLIVNNHERLDQLIRQLRKLEDVLEIHHAPEACQVFASVSHWLR
jgi:acetolactate synthase I/III small subunit